MYLYPEHRVIMSGLYMSFVCQYFVVIIAIKHAISFSWSSTIVCEIFLYQQEEAHLSRLSLLYYRMNKQIQNVNSWLQTDITALTQRTLTWVARSNAIVLFSFTNSHQTWKCVCVCVLSAWCYTRGNLYLSVMLTFITYQIISPRSHQIVQLSTIIRLFIDTSLYVYALSALGTIRQL